MRISAVVALVFVSVSVSSKSSSVPKIYDTPEAYQIYSLLLPDEEAFGFAKGTLIIQEETVSKDVKSCFTPEAATKFHDAVEDYVRVNKKRWLLQGQFQIEKPYEIVNSATIGVSSTDDWESFYERYPDSGGFIIMSAVGFNKEKTQAVVYTGTSCGVLCGRWLFHLLEKVDGNWKKVPGVTCITVS
jgi:hypothetical protein